MRYIGIDPGPKMSGYVEMVGGAVVIAMPDMANAEVRSALIHHRTQGPVFKVGIERIRSYGMAVGADVFETCEQVGRFIEVMGGNVNLIPRSDIKLHLCHSPRAKDANIRQALIDRLGPAGTKKNPGPTYGVSKHAWSALAVAVTLMDRIEARRAA